MQNTQRAYATDTDGRTIGDSHAYRDDAHYGPLELTHIVQSMNIIAIEWLVILLVSDCY